MKHQIKKHIMENENISDFFSFISKVVIILPIFIVVISLFLKFNQPKQGLINQTSTIIPTISVTKTNSIKFDLKGPIVCNSLFIQDKKVLLKNKSTNYLLNGDCLYIWDEGRVSGERKCSLSSYISMAENYLGIFDIENIINNNLVKDFIKDKDIDLKEIVKSCQIKAIKDDSIFNIPEKVLFKLK